MNTLLRKHKILAINLALLVALALVTTLMVVPSIKGIINLKKQTNTQRATLENLYEQGQDLKRSRQDYLLIKNELHRTQEIFIIKNDELNFITTLESLADEHQLELFLELSVDRVSQISTRLESIPVRLNLSGKYQNVINYLDSLESENLYINFKTVSISPGSSSAGPVQITFRGQQVISNTPSSDSVLAILNGIAYVRNSPLQ
jgi:hypothetical protein